VNLDQVTIEIRPRRPWEAVDLGLLMARRWWWPLIQAWLLVTLPLFVLLSLLTAPWAWWLGGLLIWWLKPLCERPLLHILGQAVFNQLPDTRSTLRALPKLLRPQLLPSLLWRRFSPTRSMDLPLVQLEGLAGKQRRDRMLTLHQEDASPVLALTVMGLLIEVLLAVGFLVVLDALVPSEVDFDWRGLGTGETLWLNYLKCVCAYIAMSVVAPFYTACGFSLYLNRRIKLEAWDIDIAFRRMASKRSPVAKSFLLVPFILALGFFPLPEATASDTLLVEPSVSDGNPVESSAVKSSGTESNGTEKSITEKITAEESASEALTPIDRASAKAQITAILAGEDFHKKRVLRYPVLEFKERTSLWDWVFKRVPSLEKLAAIPFAFIMELLFWLVVLVLVGVLVFRYRHWLAAYLPQKTQLPTRRRPPTSLFGLDLTRESLPEDINTAALALWQAHQPRAALGLLYRASLSRLIETGLDIEESHTEMECLTLAQSSALNVQTLNYFTELTKVWRRLAYGHLTPDTAVAERLCMTWHKTWDAAESVTKERARG
jgi:hypothetical protein